jgi:cytochrome c oxidase cbb3-type subunit 1
MIQCFQIRYKIVKLIFIKDKSIRNRLNRIIFVPEFISKNMNRLKYSLFFLAAFIFSKPAFSQTAQTKSSLFSQPGIIITIVLVLLPIAAGLIILTLRLMNAVDKLRKQQQIDEVARFAKYLDDLQGDEIETVLEKKRNAKKFRLSNTELSGTLIESDEKGLINSINEQTNIGFIAGKKKALKRPNIDPQLTRLILWYLGTATFWLLFGTSVGEYLGIKFMAPDADHLSWLSFGRLRPVHTNAVFWGWSSLAMLGLGYYVVPMVSNAKIASLKLGWYSLYLINATVIIGSICLMSGINNAGGEYREYIWPVMALFGIALALTLINFLKTIANRTTEEIYVSNWYIVSAIIFTIVISLVAYLPFWQNGLGETIAQGYYMHQGVGMWFMLFNLGLIYYFLPQQLNKPIYSYSLGIMAFWAQIFFYTVIGTHHFIFSSIPWWLQTVAIIGSVGMIIPVVAGTTNFLLTFKGSWNKVGSSYTLPFYVVGIVFYFTGSMQGTAEAFRTTNLYWHFTDFTTAHSHLTMYGIIAFMLWASIYAVMPRLTGKEPSHTWVGVHFWMALIGLMFYTIPLMIGGTLKGIMWQEGKPFIESVVLMMPYWLWRAIGGTMMWLSHIVFAYNVYIMIKGKEPVNIRKEGVKRLKQMGFTE